MTGHEIELLVAGGVIGTCVTTAAIAIGARSRPKDCNARRNFSDLTVMFREGQKQGVIEGRSEMAHAVSTYLSKLAKQEKDKADSLRGALYEISNGNPMR